MNFSISDVSVRELLHWFCSLQLELARLNYMNRKIETFKRWLVMQKTLVKVIHRNIVFVKVESSVIEISVSVHWSRCCYAISLISVWNEILLGSQGTVNQTTSCQHALSKKTSAAHRFRIEIKHLPVFINLLICVSIYVIKK